ncbi:MAG: glycine C-acetyltransferase [bacterium]
MYGKMNEYLKGELDLIREAGLYKEERIIAGKQGVEIELAGGRKVLNFCANNYLGLSSHPRVIEAAHRALDRWGYGMSSVRFICGTQEIHRQLEQKISEFLGTEDTILYAACFDANGGIFEPLLSPESAIISDELNHASIIDGVRLCKAQRYRYRHADMEDLEARLREAKEVRFRMIATDGVFSMDGDIANLAKICDLAEAHEALVMVDDSHATGLLGKSGRGTPEHCGVMGRVDVMTGTLGKALGGSTGGFTTGKKEIIEFLRQRSRPYLFSNTLAPVVAGTSLAVFEMLSETTELRDRLEENTKYFREQMTGAGFEIRAGIHPIVPIMLYEGKLAQDFARDLLEEGIYAVGFFYPVVPKGQARIRVQISAAHTREHLDLALSAMKKIGLKHGVLGK